MPSTVGVVGTAEVVVRGVEAVLHRSAPSMAVKLGAHALGSDVVVFVPSGRGNALGEQVKRILPRMEPAGRMLVLLWSEDMMAARSVVAAGASGYAHVTVDGDTLTSLIQSVYRGTAPGSAWPEVQLSSRARDLGLNERELQVLTLACRGLSNPEIAEEMFLSVNSVKSYLKSIYRRTGLSSRPRLVLWGREQGFG